MKMSGPLINIGLRFSRRHPLQTLLLVLGISLGVSGVVAIDIAKTSVSKSFELSSTIISSRSTHQIVGNDFLIPQDIFTHLRTRLGIKRSAPVISRHVVVKELGDTPLTLMGIDPFSEKYFRQFTMRSSPEYAGRDFSSLLTRSSGVFLSKVLAIENGLDQTDTITLTFGSRQIQTKISGFLDTSDSETNSAFRGLILADISFVQEILGLRDTITRIDLIVEDESQIEQIRHILPHGVLLIKTDGQDQVLRKMSASFETSLTAFSMLALFMGVFLIYNTVSFSITRKKKLNGILRAIGTTRARIFLAVMTEIMIYALIGSILGILLGIMLGRGAVHAVCSTISDIYFVLTVTQSDITVFTLLKGLSAGMLSSFFAALYPAIQASRTLPVNLMLRSASESALRKYMPYFTFSGAFLIAVAAWILSGYATHTRYDFLAVFIIFLGASLLVPLCIIGFTNTLNALMVNLWKGVAKMALRNIARSLSRTSVLIASLMVVVSVYIGIGTMTASFKRAIVEWVDGNIGGDIHISSSDELNRGLSPELLKNIQAMPEVSEVSAYSIHRFFSETSGEVHIFSYLRDVSEKQWVWTAEDENQMDLLLEKGWIFVSEIFVQRNQIKLSDGASISLHTLKGPVDFKIAGVFRDFFMGGGRVIVNREIMETYLGHTDITSMQVFLNDKTQAELVMKNIRSVSGMDIGIRVVFGEYIKKRILDVFDKTFLITVALQMLTAIVALTGILNSVMALLLERTREMGILRACGAQRMQVFWLLITECAISGLISGFLALPLGMGLSWVLIHVINQRSFGWTYDMVVSGHIFIQAVVLSCGAAIIAGVYPAIRAGQTDIQSALHTE